MIHDRQGFNISHRTDAGPRLLLVYRHENLPDNRKLAGITHHLEARPDAVTRIVDPGRLETLLPELRSWAPTVVLATGAASSDVLAGLGDVPVVRTDAPPSGPAAAHVFCHGHTAGRLAGDFLIRRQPASLACVHAGDQEVGRRRRRGFAEAATASGLPFAEFDTATAPDLGTEAGRRALATWLHARPHPCGCFAWNDNLGGAVIEACVEHGLRIPGAVLVLGVDNVPAICETTRPALSSVALPFHRIGEEAARLALLFAAGRRPSVTSCELPAEGVVERESTALPPTDDPLVLRALAAIETGQPGQVGIAGLCDELGCARRTLERRFRRALGRSVHRVLTERRVALATRLLADHRRTVATVANACGYDRAQSLEDLLRRETGKPPSAFRR